MKKIFFTAMLLMSAIYNCMAQADSSAKAKQIVKIEQQLMAAMPGNKTPWLKYLDNKWYIVTEDGRGYNKPNFLKTFAPFQDGFSGKIKIIKPVFTFYDKTAIIHFIADERESVYGQDLHTTYAIADTWYMGDNGWKMIASQIFEVPQLPKPVKLNATILKNYVGTYTLSGKKTAVISQKNDSLYIQKNMGKPEALFPETTTVFFRKSDTRGRTLFVKNKKGDVLMLERRNGNDLIWKRAK